MAADPSGRLGGDVVAAISASARPDPSKQPEHAAPGLDAHHRRQRLSPGYKPGPSPRASSVPRRPWRGAWPHARRRARPGPRLYLVPGVRARGQFQVPARILAAGAPPQRDAGIHQPQIRGVVVESAFQGGWSSRWPCARGHSRRPVDMACTASRAAVAPAAGSYFRSDLCAPLVGHVPCSSTVAQPPGPAGITVCTMPSCTGFPARARPARADVPRGGTSLVPDSPPGRRHSPGSLQTVVPLLPQRPLRSPAAAMLPAGIGWLRAAAPRSARRARPGRDVGVPGQAEGPCTVSSIGERRS